MAVGGKLRELLSQPVEEVAPRLLGWGLVRRMPEGEIVEARLIEVEAYHQREPASHSFRGPTQRNAVMFGAPGYAYVYFIYGMHYCLNVSCEPEGVGAAVLIRAAEAVRPARLRLNGPAVLCKNLAIDRSLNGTDMLDSSSPLYLKPGMLRRDERIVSSPRIGIRVANDLPWRFRIEEH